MTLAINTMKAYTATETVTMHDLQNDDLILQHGGVFRVINRRVSSGHDNLGPGGACIIFDGVFVGDAFSDTECGIPAYWRENEATKADGSNHGYWTVQGNKLAGVARITNPAPQYYHGAKLDERGDKIGGIWKHEPNHQHIIDKVFASDIERANRRYMNQRDRIDGAMMTNAETTKADAYIEEPRTIVQQITDRIHNAIDKGWDDLNHIVL